MKTPLNNTHKKGKRKMINVYRSYHATKNEHHSESTSGLILLGVISMSLIFSLLAFLFAIISICR